MKNYVTPSSPTPPRSTPSTPVGGELVPIPWATPAVAGGSRPGGLQRSYSSGPYSSGPYSPGDNTPSSPTSPYSNIYNPARGRGSHLRSFTGVSGNIAPTAGSTPYHHRPLPPLHKPHSTYSFSPKSIDLVTPISPAQEQPPVPISGGSNTPTRAPSAPTCAELLGENSWVIPITKSAEKGTMKTMFNFEKIRSGASPMVRVTSYGGFVSGMNPYGAMRSTQMPLREDAYGHMQGITTVMRN